MARAKKLIAVSWKAKSYLADVDLLDRLVECTYFRLLQGIYNSQNQFPDDDVIAARFCKCKSVKEYRAHKAELLKPRGIDPETGLEIGPRIYIFEGKIRSEKCDEQLGHASKLRAQKSGAGTASANKRAQEPKPLKSKKTRSTSVAPAVGAPVATADPTAQATAGSTADQLPLTLNPNSKKERKNPPSPQGGNAPVIEDVGKQEADPTPDPVELFETQFWKAYPQRAGANPKKPARDKFVALVKRGVDPAEIIAGARAYASDPETKIGTGYVATAVVWLNQERWKDAYSTGGPPTTTAENKALEAVPTLARGITPPLQIMMAKKYLMVWHQDGDKVVYVRAKHPNERKPWPYRNPETNEIWPLPGQPGCPVSPEAMRIAAAECRVLWPDNAPTLAEQARVDIEKAGPK